jgi:hypothetical protein
VVFQHLIDGDVPQNKVVYVKDLFDRRVVDLLDVQLSSDRVLKVVGFVYFVNDQIEVNVSRLLFLVQVVKRLVPGNCVDPGSKSTLFKVELNDVLKDPF